jgi:hypothetical protein
MPIDVTRHHAPGAVAVVAKLPTKKNRPPEAVFYGNNQTGFFAGS